MFKNIMKYFSHSATMLVGMMLCTPVLASSLSSNKVSEVIDRVTDLITSDIGKGLCTLAIIGVGFGWLKLGRLEKEQALAVIIGIGVIYSAAYIVRQFGV